jgi:hypothetical protein
MPDLPAHFKGKVPGFELVKGATVTIRGRQGTAYYMGSEAKRPPAERPTLVISTDPALAPLASALQGQFEISIALMGKVFGDDDPFKTMQAVLKTGAPLVLTGMELDRVSNEPIPASRFALPAEPLSIEGVRKNLGAPSP